MMMFAYAPWNAGWLIYPLLLPLIWTCQQADANARIFRGLAFGIGYFCIGSYWFAQTLVVHIGYSWPAALGGHLLITGACALAPAVFCWLGGYLRDLGYKTIILLPALWAVIEDIRFQAFGGGPWMSLGLSQLDMPMAGYLPLFGEVGSSFPNMVIVCCLALGIQSLRSKAFGKASILLGAGLVIVFSGTILKTLNWTQPLDRNIDLALVQSAVPQHEKGQPERQQAHLEELLSLSQPYLGKVDLLIWPETVVSLDQNAINRSLDAFSDQAMFARTTLLLGAYQPALDGKRFNIAYTLGYEGGQQYRKRHLVPFGEYVPEYLWFLEGYVPGDKDRHLGRYASMIANTGALFGISICWEGSFSRDNTPIVRAGANVLLNIANEAWFAGSSLPQQNLDAMRVRAIEHGRPAIRVANFGPGAIINAKGEELVVLQEDAAGSVSGTLQAYTGLTPFALIGADTYTLAFALLVFLGAWSQRRKKRSLGGCVKTL